MKTILVAVDGSAHSLKGVTMAAMFAKALGARLELAHVEPPILLPPVIYAETIQKLEAGNLAHAKALLSTAVEQAKALGVEAEPVVLQGAPAEAIAELVQADRYWGVVVGAKGHNAVSRVLLGSVTDRLVHVCHKPVLVVR